MIIQVRSAKLAPTKVRAARKLAQELAEYATQQLNLKTELLTNVAATYGKSTG